MLLLAVPAVVVEPDEFERVGGLICIAFCSMIFTRVIPFVLLIELNRDQQS